MHILLFSEIDPYYSERNRLHWFAEALAAEHQVTIVGMRDFTKTTIKQELQGIPVHFLNTDGESPSRVDATPWPYFTKLSKLVDLESVDLVFSYNGLRFSAYLAKKMRHVPFMYDLCDDLANLAAESPYMPRPLAPAVRAVAAHYIRKNCKLAARITVTHPLLGERFGAPKAKMVEIGNGYFWKTPTGPKPNLPVKDTGDVWVLFVGALREWVDDFAVIMREMANWPEHWKLLIVGDEGTKIAALKKLMEDLPHRDRIRFLGHVPHVWLPELLQQADAGLIIKRSNMMDLAMPLKLLEYASWGLPVVSTQLRLVKEMFGDIVHIVEPGATWRPQIEAALQDDRQTIQKRVEAYAWPLLTDKLLDTVSLLRADL